MRFTFFKNTLFLLVLICFSCGSGSKSENASNGNDIAIHDSLAIEGVLKDTNNHSDSQELTMGAQRFQEYEELLRGKNVGIVANQTSVVTYRSEPDNSYREINVEMHLVDFLLRKGIRVKKVFAPEHGFRGEADAGEAVKDGLDTNTGLPIISLYGKNKKPSQEQLGGLDVIIFDIQDVGARFYTYISTLHYVMEACAENNVSLIVMDRPNPNGHYIDGPILEPEHQSFVGMHPVPVVHGMTIGEYAQMINGEEWLKNKAKCKLKVIQMLNYSKNTEYSLPIRPSPNLPNDSSINLYPSLCFFEGTIVSAGRGTDMQFQVFGAPELPKEYFPFTFTPQSNEGAKYPKFKGEVCNGLDLRETKKLDRLNLEWLIEAYVGYGKKPNFFNSFFTKLAGTGKLQNQIESGYTYPEIRANWIRDLKDYDLMRKEYLIYK
ncbi:MAG: DUF1343 domain-containing protein [Bacteroidia bacterium]|nr:DUF1343 domain-containing protein [Bacteroidia bacterium]NNF32265.1 DUF1343 domain-containing protein [Flavobacteriaceae bacterium]MBT8276907.1 DUF1343 domain-containing protein [Bacteroidia bacterium]NNJ82901.1 DUF1343 domain-containing protein [Flavobacteriaceae bacterium]NNK53776.1 DUF1343 domain-containing protein [Flavobacteriaceae bacterium]